MAMRQHQQEPRTIHQRAHVDPGYKCPASRVPRDLYTAVSTWMTMSMTVYVNTLYAVWMTIFYLYTCGYQSLFPRLYRLLITIILQDHPGSSRQTLRCFPFVDPKLRLSSMPVLWKFKTIGQYDFIFVSIEHVNMIMTHPKSTPLIRRARLHVWKKGGVMWIPVPIP